MNQDRLYYSLSDAAETLKIKEKDLLHFGAQETISIMVAVPEQLKAIQHQKKLVPGHVRVTHTGVPTPLFLALKPSYCLKVEANNETSQSEFPFGYYLPELKEGDKSIGCDLLLTYPDIETDSVEDPVHVWATVGKPLGSHCWENYIFKSNGASQDTGIPIHINLSKLLLPKSAVNLLREKLKKDKENNECPATSIGTQAATIASDDAKGKEDVSRNSLLKLVIGMAVDTYGYDHTAKKNTAPSEIEKNLALAGINITNDTIRKALQEAASKFPPETNFKSLTPLKTPIKPPR